MGKIKAEIEGLNLDRFLNTLFEKSIAVQNVERPAYNKLIFECKKSDFNEIKKLLETFKIEFKIVGWSGLLYWVRSNWYRFGLLIGVIFAIYASFYVTGFYWNVEVEVDTLNPEMVAKVTDYLNSQNLKVGAKIRDVSTRDIERLILKNIDDCAMVVVENEGVTLKVFVKQAENGRSLSNSNIVAGFSGVIEEINLGSGTLLVNIGDAVVEGQPLIQSGNVGDVFMEARGEIVAKCLISGDAVGSTQLKTEKRTGNCVTVAFIEVMGKKFYSSEMTEIDAQNCFSNYEIEEEECQLSKNNLVPIKKTCITYYEIEEVCDIINIEQLTEDLKSTAYNVAKAKLPNGAPELGITYSVINQGELVRVVCNIETRLNIARRGE